MNLILNDKKILSANSLKIIAIIAMTIDHIAWAFVPFDSFLGQSMHIIGRLTAPIMCYFIAEGYFHTRSVKRYALRLFCFALISHIPFVLFESGKPFSFFPMNVIYTLLLGLLALLAYDKIKNEGLKTLAIIACMILSIGADWGIFGVIFILIFGQNHGNFKEQMRKFSMVAISMVLLSVFFSLSNRINIFSQLFQLGVLLSIPLLYLYNGEQGKFKGLKWIFYIFYPLHLLIIALFKIYVSR